MAAELAADVAVIGGGLGGVAAALAAARAGWRVVLTEETDWLGGQLTSQAVPPDEHPWIEQFGCSASYRQLRELLRDYYRRWYPLSPDARSQRYLNPGRAVVSAVCVEPRAGVSAIDAMLAPHRTAGRIRVLTDHRPVAVATVGDQVSAVTVRHAGGDEVYLAASYVLDATETGELLPLAGAEHVTGAESRARTGEPHAPESDQPWNMQAISWCFALDHLAGEDHVIDRPAGYEFWRSHHPPAWPGPLLSFVARVPRTGEPLARTFTPNPEATPIVDHRTVGGDRELWTFRRVAARETFAPGFLASDITLVNWPMIDYFQGPIYGGPPQQAQAHLRGARELSLSFLYWLQTEAPRPDGGTGYPGLRLRPDVVGTSDGLAKRPYVRESRRILAPHTVVEQEVTGAPVPARVPDSVGVGSYRIDLHPSTGGDGYIDIASRPFEIPLRALVPVRLENLLPAAKNLGTTHITNGCFRLHPVEWSVGEAAGALAAFCLAGGHHPQQVCATPELLQRFQARLTADGVELRWPEVRGY